ncbi:SpoIIE family protein phosphatase [Nocardia sp. NPDC051321]|uniref:SpoIIE family protein phosphatase n=1 Tax=Nocardia sp. NPDC051321 TaxID=3364323 RepID=UPI0037B07B95
MPVGLVALVGARQQSFPGQAGLPQPWSDQRSAPLSHSFCPVVVATAAPLVVSDARDDPRFAESPAVTDLGVVAYAGMPLTDSAGHVLGALCAIGHTPRDWRTEELDELSWLAERCSTELSLRLAGHETALERQRTDTLQGLLGSALHRSQLMLTAAQSFSDLDSVVELRDRIAELVAGDLKPSRVQLIITNEQDPRSTAEDQFDPTPPDIDAAPVPAGQWGQFDTGGPLLTAQVVREARLISHDDLRGGTLAPSAARDYLDAGLLAVTAAPILDIDGVAGVLEFAWDQPHQVDITEQATIVTMASFVATALHRIRFLRSRIGVVHQLQQAMLTDLPAIPGLRLGARYLPAEEAEQVGGDWYDVFTLPSSTGAAATTAILVGDVVGTTSTPRPLWVNSGRCCGKPPGHSPADALTALDGAAAHLIEHTTGTTVLAYLSPVDDGTGRWAMTWSNAGHPPPIVLEPDRGITIATEHDHLLGYPELFAAARTDRRRLLAPGSTVLLYTDGLIEHTGTDFDAAINSLADLAADTRCRRARAADRHHPAHFRPAWRPDDIAILAVHIR